MDENRDERTDVVASSGRVARFTDCGNNDYEWRVHAMNTY